MILIAAKYSIFFNKMVWAVKNVIFRGKGFFGHRKHLRRAFYDNTSEIFFSLQNTFCNNFWAVINDSFHAKSEFSCSANHDISFQEVELRYEDNFFLGSLTVSNKKGLEKIYNLLFSIIDEKAISKLEHLESLHLWIIFNSHI